MHWGVQEKRKNLLKLFQTLLAFNMSAMIYPHRTDLKAWGKDNSSDFRMFDVRHLGNNKDLVTVCSLKGGSRLSSPSQFVKQNHCCAEMQKGKLILVETHPRVHWHKSSSQSHSPSQPGGALAYHKILISFIMGQRSHGGRCIWLNYLLWCCHSTADTQVSLSCTVLSPILSASLRIPFKLQDVTQ